MKKLAIQFGIGSRIDDGEMTYSYFESQGKRDAALGRLHLQARMRCDEHAHTHQRVLSLGEGHLAIEMPEAQPVSYAWVTIHVPDPKLHVAADMPGRIELFSGAVELLPLEKSDKAFLRRFLRSGQGSDRLKDAFISEPAGRHSDGRNRDVYLRIERLAGGIELRARSVPNLRERILRAKALQRLQDEHPGLPIRASELEAIETAPVATLLPLTNRPASR
ncbi:hypothetical protein WL29_20620 [Burkholderia ubonensis]|uniref:Uncharacterized protein n=1 Tax=Burkholderia ubonensis TaxID=101571 RepID=A0A106QC33_9BURK|nr:hypothetical protein [Burkholderia ubonensis]KWA83771.1 hypothetical protein WL29_20620 [Burkholderia ubonensis]